MKKRVFKDYQGKLLHDLQDPELAIAYLEEALLDEDPRILNLHWKMFLKLKSQDQSL